jgi:hypothetical protein
MPDGRGQDDDLAKQRAWRATQMARAVMSAAPPPLGLSDPVDRLERAAERHRHGLLSADDLAAEEARICAEVARRA